MNPETRRERLLRFANQTSVDTGHRQWSLKLGDLRLPYSILTGEALEDLCERMVRDFWTCKRSNRLNRAIRQTNATAVSKVMGS